MQSQTPMLNALMVICIAKISKNVLRWTMKGFLSYFVWNKQYKIQQIMTKKDGCSKKNKTATERLINLNAHYLQMCLSYIENAKHIYFF